jgi:hypothetical protein
MTNIRIQFPADRNPLRRFGVENCLRFAALFLFINIVRVCVAKIMGVTSKCVESLLLSSIESFHGTLGSGKPQMSIGPG